jgi:hypothetical protein
MPSVDNSRDLQQEPNGVQVKEPCRDDKANTEGLDVLYYMLRALEDLDDASDSPVFEARPNTPSQRDVSSVQHRVRRLHGLIQLLQVNLELTSYESTRESNRVNTETGTSKEPETVSKMSSKHERDKDINNRVYTRKEISQILCRQSKDSKGKLAARKKNESDESSPERDSTMFWAKELLDACKLLKLMCENFVSAQPNVSGTFLRLASKSTDFASLYMRLVDVYFVLSVFSSLLLSVIANIMSGFSLSYIMDMEPQYLVTTIRKLTHVYAQVEFEFQDVYTSCVNRVLSAKSRQHIGETKRHKVNGNEWLIKRVFSQLDVANEHLKMVSEKLGKLCDPDVEPSQASSSDQPDFETDPRQPSVKERFRTVGQKLAFIEERLSLLTRVLKISRNMK